jgi:hypothetical protein
MGLAEKWLADFSGPEPILKTPNILKTPLDGAEGEGFRDIKSFRGKPGNEILLSSDSVELLHPRDCPQWWQGCLAGCPWYHPGGGDFCWKVNRAWWEEPYRGGNE